MSASQCATTIFPLAGSTGILRRPSSTMSRRKPGGLFGSLRKTLSKKQTPSSSVQQNSHPQTTYIAQPTRRPGRCDALRTGNRSIDSEAVASPNPFDNPSSFDAPPAYSATPETAVQKDIPNNPARPVSDDAYAFLDIFDTIFVIDDSGSMAGGLWRETADAVKAITPICTSHDADGIDIHFLNHQHSHENVTSASKVQEIFQTVRPGGATPIGRVLDRILRTHNKMYARAPENTKPINVICITDGVPTDDVEGALIQAAKKLDKLDAPAWQVGVQFFQVGNDRDATAHLKQLDDDLNEIAGDDDLRDMVDTVPFTDANGARLSADGILKVVLGAVTRRLDRRSRELHR